MALKLRIVLTFLWLAFSSVVMVLLSIPRWGDPNLDHDFARLFAWGAQRILGLRVVLEGAEHLEAHQPCVYLANHQSGLDVLIFCAITPKRILVIGKKEILWIPFFGLAFLAGGNIMIDRKQRVKSIGHLSEAAEAIRKKRAGLWIFPEGTRNRTEQPMLPFKKGAFHMAVQAGLPLVPVVAESTRGLVDTHNWRLTKKTIRVRALDPETTAGMTPEQVDALIEKVRGKMMEAFHGLSSDHP